MPNPPKEVIAIVYVSILFWVVVVSSIFAFGQRWERVRVFRDLMLEQWRPALAILVIYQTSVFLSGRGLNPYGLKVFCQAWMGLAIARGILHFEPLPVSQSLIRRERVIQNLLFFAAIGLAASVIGIIAGSVAMGIAQHAFHETSLTNEIMQGFSVNKLQAFFMLLAGAGIAEEATYRLFLLSFLWALTKRPWLAVVISAIFHSAYHLTPLNQLYLTFLHFPISQFVSGVVISSVWGYLFIKRGYETTVLAHTLSDWLPMLFFM